MNGKRIDVVSRFPPDTTSLRNLLQGLRAVDEPWEVHRHQLRRPDLPGDNVVTAGVEHGCLTLSTLRTGLELRQNSDLVVVHKPLQPDLLGRLSGRHVPGRVFLGCRPVVYATFDANYVHAPGRSRLLFERADLVYATSEAIASEASEHAPEDRVAYIPPSVDTERFTPDRPVPDRFDAEDELVLGWIGNVEPHEDNLGLVADALSAVDLEEAVSSGDPEGVVLRFVYSGGEFPGDLRERLAATGARVELVGAVPHDRMPGVINGFDVGLAPLLDTPFDRGRSSEKVREYMACGVPVLASPVGEHHHMIPDDAGFLVADPGDWERALATLSDRDVRREMGRAAREHAVEEYSIRTTAERIRSAFRDLLRTDGHEE